MSTGGGAVEAYAHTSTIDVFHVGPDGVKNADIAFTIQDTPLDFLPKLHTVLLGVRRFLAGFILTIDYPRRVFSLQEPGDRPSRLSPKRAA